MVTETVMNDTLQHILQMERLMKPDEPEQFRRDQVQPSPAVVREQEKAA